MLGQPSFSKTLPNAPSRSFSTLVFTAVICLSGSPSRPGVSDFSTMESHTQFHFHFSEPWTEQPYFLVVIPLSLENISATGLIAGDTPALRERPLASLVETSITSASHLEIKRNPQTVIVTLLEFGIFLFTCGFLQLLLCREYIRCVKGAWDCGGDFQ